MSYIDTFDNEFVGFFGGLPVYHPLETVEETSDCPEDFGCGPENLVIGGGSGEHPGIVIKAPGEAVVCFVRDWLSEANPYLSPEVRAALQPALEAWPDANDGETWSQKWLWRRNWRHVFEFAGWLAKDYVQFCALCASEAFHTPYDASGHRSLEQWLAASVGEFVLFAMPELAEDAVRRLGDLRNYLSGDLYKNILLAPPGYPVWGRREVEGHVKWGLSAWRIERASNPRTIRGG